MESGCCGIAIEMVAVSPIICSPAVTGHAPGAARICADKPPECPPGVKKDCHAGNVVYTCMQKLKHTFARGIPEGFARNAVVRHFIRGRG